MIITVIFYFITWSIAKGAWYHFFSLNNYLNLF